MSQDSTGSSSWQVLAAELRACREKQQQTWGDLDHALIGRYLAGEVTPEERARVEASLDNHPELRVLTEVVSEVLGESTPQAVEPTILTFPSVKKPVRSRFQRYQRRFALAAAACLLVGLSFALNPYFPSSNRSSSSSNSNNFFAMRDSMKLNGHTRTVGGIETPGLPLPEMDLVARADALVDRGEFEKAAHLLFDPSRKEGIQPVAEPESLSPRRNLAVAKLAERVLGKMSWSVADAKDADPGVRSPSTPKGTHEVNVVSAKMSDENNVHSDILSRSALYLVDGLKYKENVALRDRNADVLAQMGPYAVPALTDTLRKPGTSPIQQAAVVNVLKQMGPRARQAELVLEELARNGCEQVSPKAREALTHVRMPLWVGVRDRAGVLDEKSHARINERIAALSKKHQLHVAAETVRKLPVELRGGASFFKTEDERLDNTTNLLKLVDQRCKAAGADKGVYVLICMDPPSVRVKVGGEAKTRTAKTWSADVAQSRMQESMKKRDLDKGLEEVVQMIEQAIAE